MDQPQNKSEESQDLNGRAPLNKNVTGDKKSKTGLMAVIIIIIIILILSSIGYFIYKKVVNKISGEAEEKAIEKLIETQTGEKADVDINNGNFKVESGDGSIEVNQEAKWSEDVPSSVPQLNEGTLKITTKFSTEKGDSWSIAYENTTSTSFENYVNQLKNSGWKENFTANTESDRSSSLQKDNIVIVVYFVAETKETVLNVTVSK